MTTAKRVGLIATIFLAIPLLLVYPALFQALAESGLRLYPGLVAAAPHLAENLSRMAWLAVECLPLLVWRSWRDVGALRLRWSRTVLVLAVPVLLLSSRFGGWPTPHPWTGTLDLCWQNLLVAANEELIFRGYMFHNRPELHPRLTVLFSSVAFALFHYVNLNYDHWQGVSTQVGIAFLIGLGAGTVRLATGSLGWCILLHWWIDAAHDLGGRNGEFTTLTEIVGLPFWVVLTLIIFAVHPALRRACAVSPPPTPDGTGRWSMRRVAASLLGVTGGMALLLALIVPFTSSLNPSQRLIAAAVLVGTVGVPCGMLAVTVIRWRHWQGWPVDPGAVLPKLLPEGLTPSLRVVKVSSMVLFGVTLLIILCLANVLSTMSFSFSPAPGLGLWGTIWRDRLPLGCFALAVLSPPCIAWFSLTRAIHPRISWSTTVVWTSTAIFYGFLTWLTVIHVHWVFMWCSVLKLCLWNPAAAGLIAALFLTLRDLFPPGRGSLWAGGRETEQAQDIPWRPGGFA